MSISKAYLEKYFDDGVVQYWRMSAKNATCANYRITIQPSGVSIDRLGRSWNGCICWITAYSNMQTIEQAVKALKNIMGDRQDDYQKLCTQIINASK